MVGVMVLPSGLGAFGSITGPDIYSKHRPFTNYMYVLSLGYIHDNMQDAAVE